MISFATDRNAEHYRALLGLYAWGLDSGGLVESTT